MNEVDRAVSEVIEAIESADVLRRILSVVLDSSLRLAEADEGGVLICHPRTGDLSLEEWRGTVSQDRFVALCEPRSVCAAAARDRKTIAIPDVTKDDRFRGLSDAPVLSELAAPIVFAETVVGVLNVESLRPAAFRSIHEDRLRDFASRIAPYLQAVISVERERRLFQAIGALRVVNEAIRHGHESVLARILGRALALTNASIGGILLHDPDSQSLRLTVTESLKPQHIGRRITPDQGGLVWACFDEARQLNVADVTRDPRYLDLSEGTIRSLLATPLFADDKPIGVLNIESTQFRAFDFLHEEIFGAWQE